MEAVMITTVDLVYGLPQKELVERLYFHRRQGEVSERALGFYLLDMERRNAFQPETDAATWARKHLPGCPNPRKLIQLAERLEELPSMAEAFSEGKVPWTKIREVARIATAETEEEWLDLARKLNSRDLEREVAGVKRGDRPGGGLKAKRPKRIERLLFSGAEKVIWDRAIRKAMVELGKGATPSKAAIHLAELGLTSDPEGNIAGRKRHGGGLATIVLHIGRDGKRWVDTDEGRMEIDRETFEEIARAGARTIEVKDVHGTGDCPAIHFGERGLAAPEDRDRPVSAEVKEAVLLRDGACVICGGTEDLTPHHLDSHADGGSSDMTRLVTLCLFCQGAVHGGELVLGVDGDGEIWARDLEGNLVTRPRSQAQVLAEGGNESPLTTLEGRGTPPPAATSATDDRDLLTLDALPPEITSAQWMALERWIEWSAGQRVFLFRPDGDSSLADAFSAGEASPQKASAPADLGIRPGTIDDFIGQRRAVENLSLAARAAKTRARPLAHVVLSGQPGLGKTTIARLLARQCGSGLEETVGGNITDPRQLVSLLARLQKGSFLLVDEIHALTKDCEEFLYPAMDDGMIGVVLRQGTRTRIIRVRLEPFTLVGTTTRLGALSEPFRSRFPLRERLEPYTAEELAQLAAGTASRMGTAASPEAAREVARRARGTPRDAIRILERSRDISELEGASCIESAHVGRAAARLGIDHNGLDDVDRATVKFLLNLGRPLGEEALAARLGLDRETFHDVHEPYLERLGLIERTERGRVATEEARRLYGRVSI
jgi:holliday junction DNA helicase RuvB